MITVVTGSFEKTLGTHLEESLQECGRSLINLVKSPPELAGWYQYPARKGFDLTAQIKEWKEKIPVHYDAVIVIGIGGSYLGSRAIYEALTHEYAGFLPKRKAKHLPLFFSGYHLSEASTVELLDVLENCDPLVNVISKSGTTTETSVAFRIVRDFLEKKYGEKEARLRIVATTDPEKGALRSMARTKKYPTFEVPPDIGGRYSVLSAVGIVPLALAGIDIEKLMEGAHTGFSEIEAALRSDVNSVCQYAACRLAAQKKGKTIETLAFEEPKLRNFAEWWKQLFGESEGKNNRGLYPTSLILTTDLHSLGQYMQEGGRTMMETFLQFKSPLLAADALSERRLRVPMAQDPSDELGYLEGIHLSEINRNATKATWMAHSLGDVPSIVIEAPSCDARGLGELIAFFETACAVSCMALGVNPFDQPGVESYKKNLFGMMGKPGFEAQGKEVRSWLADAREK